MLNRRNFLNYLPATLLSLSSLSVLKSAANDKIAKNFTNSVDRFPANSESYQGLSPIETLMEGHGLLIRCYVLYDVMIDGIENKKTIDPKWVLRTTNVIKDYLEGFHEKMEEEYIFAPMEKAKVHYKSIQELKMQHGVGFSITDKIIELAKNDKLNQELCKNLKSFGQMYRYHSAWEDTIIFPAFNDLENNKYMADLAATFDVEKRKILGTLGFDSFIKTVIDVEEEMKVFGLPHWTPTI